MFTLNATGFIGSITVKPTPSGAKLLIMRIGCETSIKDDETKQWRDETFWVEAIAWNEKADEWEKRFSVGDAVELSGRPNFRIWTNKNGETTKTITLYGQEGETPKIWFVPSKNPNRQAQGGQPARGRYQQQAPADDRNDEIPF